MIERAYFLSVLTSRGNFGAREYMIILLVIELGKGVKVLTVAICAGMYYGGGTD